MQAFRVVFDIFNIIFQFCYLKSKFWGGFPPQKYPSNCLMYMT